MIDRRSILRGLAALPLLATPACGRSAALSDGPAGDGPPTGPVGGPAAQAGPLHTRLVPGANEQVPVIGIGTARRYADPAGDEQLAILRQTIARFVELGGKMIDTAPSYGRAEEVIGRIVEELGVRDRLFLATKVAGASAAEGQVQIAQSFRNLRTDVIDLIALHNPQDAANKLAILRELKTQGRVRSIGASFSSRVGFAPSIDEATLSAAQYAGFEALMRREPLDAIQVDYAIDNRGAAERVLPLAQDRGMAVMVNLPFGRGRLFEATEGRPLPDWAAEIGATSWAQIFLKYIVSHPARPIAIPGTARPQYVDDNIGAARGPLPDAAMRRRMEQYIDAL
jgi:aryl-alcohol dehydrogenase-like predicted oxidoreductase